MVLYIQGPSVNSNVQARISGMYSTKPDNVQVRILKGGAMDSGKWARSGGLMVTPLYVAPDSDHPGRSTERQHGTGCTQGIRTNR